jgi:CelD/BcsL family acetyltransferase involved in cellulose biosynthesis
MSIYQIDPRQDPRWSEFVAKHPQSSVFHSTAWLQALARTYGYEVCVFTTSAPGAPLSNGIVFCRVKSWLTGRRMVSLPFSDHCQPLLNKESEWLEIADALNSRKKLEGLKYIELRPLSFDGLDLAGAAQTEEFCFHAIDLQPTVDELFKRCHKKSVQQSIQRAEREDLVVEQGRSERLLRQFYSLFVITRRKHQLPPQPFSWFRNIAEYMGDKLTISVASKSRRPIAAIITLLHNQTMVYKYGCSAPAFNNLGGTPFLLWRRIQEAKEIGIHSFDFGRSDLNNTGLITFKERWGAVRSRLVYLRFMNEPVKLVSPPLGAQFVLKAFASLPNCCLTVAGKLLYKHVG